MSERLLELIRVRYGETTGYLLLGQSSMFFADIIPKVVKEDAIGAKTAGVEAMFDIVRTELETDSKSGKLVVTEEKKALRRLFEAYRNTRDKNILKSLSVGQVFNADHSIQLLDRIIPYSSISKLENKDQFITITQQLSRTPLAAKIYGGSTTWRFDVREDGDLFRTLVKTLRDLLPNNVLS